jgi:hypothetical protein
MIAIIVISYYGIFQESRANCYSKYVFLSKTSPGLHENPISIFFPQPDGKYRLLLPSKCELPEKEPKIHLIKRICPPNAPFPGVSQIQQMHDPMYAVPLRHRPTVVPSQSSRLPFSAGASAKLDQPKKEAKSKSIRMYSYPNAQSTTRQHHFVLTLPRKQNHFQISSSSRNPLFERVSSPLRRSRPMMLPTSVHLVG